MYVKISEIVYKNDSGWGVFKTDKGKCIGVIPWEVKINEEIKLIDGSWRTSDYDGSKEYKFESASVKKDFSSKDLLSYAISLTKGMGDSFFEPIWNSFGENWNENLNLDGIKRINDTIIFNWQSTLEILQERKEMSETISFFMGKGLTINMANSCWNEWGFSAIGKIESNPYNLCELPNYGFTIFDRIIVKNFNIKNINRVEACILYIFKNLSNGSTVINFDEIKKSVIELLKNDNDISDSIISLTNSEKIIRIRENEYSLKSEYDYEMTIFKWSRDL